MLLGSYRWIGLTQSEDTSDKVLPLGSEINNRRDRSKGELETDVPQLYRVNQQQDKRSKRKQIEQISIPVL